MRSLKLIKKRVLLPHLVKFNKLICWCSQTWGTCWPSTKQYIRWGCMIRLQLIFTRFKNHHASSQILILTRRLPRIVNLWLLSLWLCPHVLVLLYLPWRCLLRLSFESNTMFLINSSIFLPLRRCCWGCIGEFQDSSIWLLTDYPISRIVLEHEGLILFWEMKL